MSFASPLWLILLVLVPLVVILHAIAVRWRNERVSSLAFWSDALRERKTSARLRRILRSLTLLFEVLAIAALALSLAGPRVSRRGFFAAGDTILVLDATASMKTREGARTRFDLARSRALEVLDGLRGGSRMSIIVAGRSPRLTVPFSGDRELLSGAIRAAAPTDEPGNLRDSLLFALSLRDLTRGDQVILVTDGAADFPASVDLTVPWLRILLVGSSKPNIGITAMQFRRTLQGEEEYELFLTVNNWSYRPVTVPLIVSADRSAERNPIVAEKISLAPGGDRSLSFPWKGPTEGRVVASIATGDDFPTDDAAYAVFAPAHAVRVLLVSPGNPFLEKGLSALPNVTVRNADQLGETPSDVVVFDGTEVPPLEKGNYILFACVPPNLPLRISGSLSVPPVTSWARNHPLLGGISLQGLAIEQALHLEPGAGFSPLALSNGSPLMLAWDHAGLKVVVVAFDERRSDFPLRAGFPVFLANALSWFFPSWLSVQAEQVQAGGPKVLPAVSGKIVVERPDGTRVTTDSNEQSVQFDDTAEVGFYRVESGGSRSEFAVNLLSPEESDISPRLAEGGKGEGGPAAAPRGIGGESGAPLWGALCLFAAVLILAEWLSWLRSPDMRGTRR